MRNKLDWLPLGYVRSPLREISTLLPTSNRTHLLTFIGISVTILLMLHSFCCYYFNNTNIVTIALFNALLLLLELLLLLLILLI